MADQNTQTTIPDPPQILPGREVYDMIMEKIEPELTLEGVKLLDEKYAAETPEQTKARAERYAKAREEYQKQYAAYRMSLEEQIHAYEKHGLELMEGQARAAEQESLDSLESSIANA